MQNAGVLARQLGGRKFRGIAVTQTLCIFRFSILGRFMQHLITYEEFAQDPVSILANDDLVVQIGGKFYPWKAAAPQLMSMTAFKTPLAEVSREEGEDEFAT